jgi:hypothetical protein
VAGVDQAPGRITHRRVLVAEFSALLLGSICGPTIEPIAPLRRDPREAPLHGIHPSGTAKANATHDSSLLVVGIGPDLPERHEMRSGSSTNFDQLNSPTRRLAGEFCHRSHRRPMPCRRSPRRSMRRRRCRSVRAASRGERADHDRHRQDQHHRKDRCRVGTIQHHPITLLTHRHCPDKPAPDVRCLCEPATVRPLLTTSDSEHAKLRSSLRSKNSPCKPAACLPAVGGSTSSNQSTSTNLTPSRR